jgi:spermidine synthase
MARDVIWQGETPHNRYEIVDTLYDGRPARVLYSGDRNAAQSGVAKDDNPSLLFDYNQRFLELTEHVLPNRVLLIGGGVGTLPMALLQKLPNVRVDMVEPDETLTRLAYEYFGLPVDECLRIFHTDGRSYLAGTAERYDLILVDAFVHTGIPRNVKSVEAFQAYAAHLSPRGMVAMNIISAYRGRSSYVLREIQAAAMQSFAVTDLFLAGRGYSLWLPQNFILVAQKQGGVRLRDYLRYEIDQLENIRLDEALHDQP